MCYKVFTHTMSCDARPVITSTKTLYVNPYDAPPVCPCAGPSPRNRSRSRSRGRRHPLSSSSSSERCPLHGCCALDVAVYRCARRCREPTKYNRYLRALPEQPSPSYPHSSPHPSKLASPDPFAAPPWRRLRTFDRDPDFCAVESRDFRFAVAELLDIGRVLLHAEAELDKARLRIDRERARHRAAHGGAACGRNGCGRTARVAEMAVGADDLALSAEVLADCWVRYVGLLRRYEGLGQRRVGGIVEDRGRGVRRRGEVGSREAREEQEAGPWRHVRRAGWDRQDRGDSEGRREETAVRAGRCQPEPVRKRRGSHSVRFEEEVQPRRKSQQGSSGGKRHRSWWRF